MVSQFKACTFRLVSNGEIMLNIISAVKEVMLTLLGFFCRHVYMSLESLWFVNHKDNQVIVIYDYQLTNYILLCQYENESRDHTYFLCPYSSAVWNHFPSGFTINSISNSWETITHSLLSQSISNKHMYLSTLTWQATVNYLWLERNDRIIEVKATIKNRISKQHPCKRAAAILVPSLPVTAWLFSCCFWFTIIPSA